MKDKRIQLAGDGLSCWFVRSAKENFSEEKKAVALVELMFRRIETAKKAEESSENVGNSSGGVL